MATATPVSYGGIHTVQHLSSARRLTAAVTAVLAVTTGALVGSPGAVAAPQAPAALSATPAATADAPLAAVPAGAYLVSAGPSGFLTRTPTVNGTEHRWTSYADGATQLLPARGVEYFGSEMADLVVRRNETQSTYWFQNMVGDTGGISTGLSYGDPRHRPYGIVGRKLVMGHVNDQDVLDVVVLMQHPNASSSTSVRVTEIPGNARVTRVTGTGVPDLALVTYRIDSQYHLAALNLTTGKFVERRTASPGQTVRSASLTAGHWAWTERSADGTVQLATSPRGPEQPVVTTPLGQGTDAQSTHLAGDWTLTSQTGGGTALAPSPLHALTARHVTSGETVRLLDHVSSTALHPDGSLVVRGGTTDRGEGFYRIATGEDGRPTATLITGLGVPTAVGLAAHTVPPVVDLDKSGTVPLSWTLIRSNAATTITLRHVRTGRTTQTSGERMDHFRMDWPGTLGADIAPNGDYVWEVVAKPLNGIGPDLRKTGTFKVVRKAALHDYDDNGTPDLLALDASGRLWKDEVRTDWSSTYWSTGRKLAGTGWGIYNRIENVGDIAGAPAADLVARDASGVLWLYLGKGDGTFAPRVRLGAGWNAYDKLTGGSDLNSDGKADMLATDTTGGLWLYKGTGSWSAPFAPRVRIGTGFGIYNQLTATGDLGGTVSGDLLARDTSGVLWFYPGNGSGGFAPRVRLGAGWGAFTHLVGLGDANRDGRNDLYAYGPGGSYVYPGTGNATAPFGPRVTSSIHPATTTPFNPVV